MKNLINNLFQVIIVLLLIINICITAKILNKEDIIAEEIEEVEEVAEPILSREDTIVAMSVAFAIQETKCQDLTSSDGKYVGYLQMSEILIREVNNILGKKIFSYNDRHDWNCCIAMFSIIMDDKNPELDINKAIDIWNKYCPAVYRKSVIIYYEFMLKILNNFE